MMTNISVIKLMFIGKDEFHSEKKYISVYSHILETYIEELQYISKHQSVKKYYDVQL